ncbi:MAG: aromatic acid exporter family protein [Andreesenia angusta]|nr:aromatic acid exporter family protein [Andreesenia angusta]
MGKFIDFTYRPGLRAIKTSVAIFLCLLVGSIFWFSNPFYSIIPTILCIQPTYMQSKFMGIHRVAGTAIAGIFSLLTLEIMNIIPIDDIKLLRIFIIPIAGFLIIIICNYLRLKSSVITASITFIVIIFTSSIDDHSALNHVIYRSIDTLIGVGIGLIVNKYFFRKKSLEQLKKYKKLDSEDLEDM